MLEDRSYSECRSVLVIDDSAYVWMVKSVRQLMLYRECPRVAF